MLKQLLTSLGRPHHQACKTHLIPGQPLQKMFVLHACI